MANVVSIDHRWGNGEGKIEENPTVLLYLADPWYIAVLQYCGVVLYCM